MYYCVKIRKNWFKQLEIIIFHFTNNGKTNKTSELISLNVQYTFNILFQFYCTLFATFFHHTLSKFPLHILFYFLYYICVFPICALYLIYISILSSVLIRIWQSTNPPLLLKSCFHLYIPIFNFILVYLMYITF